MSSRLVVRTGRNFQPDIAIRVTLRRWARLENRGRTIKLRIGLPYIVQPELRTAPMDDRISGISTMWTVLRDAHGGSADAALAAQQLLVERYGPPVKRYLLKLSGDADVTDELFQDFAIRLIQGDFRNVDPERGRFRSYLKTVLVRTVARHRQKAVRPQQELDEVAAEPNELDGAEFDDDWRQHLLERTWSALRDTRIVYEQALQLKMEYPDASSEELANRFSQMQQKEYTNDSYRQLLHRSRKRFAQLLIGEIAHSLQTADREHIEDELCTLDLHRYCRDALEDWT